MGPQVSVRLEPYVSFGGQAFALTRAQVLALHGEPLSESRDARVALNALDYGELVFRFQDGGRLEEIGLAAPVLQLGRVAVPFASLAGFVRAQDAGAFERAGFIVSPALGLAFVPDEPCWVTALAAHCLPSWREL
jgi:hypothetical protein